MRVLHVIASVAPRYGGPSYAVKAFASASAQRGATVRVLTTTRGLADDERAVAQREYASCDVELEIHDVVPPRRFATSPSLLRALRRSVPEFDVVHVHSLYLFHTAAAARTAARSDVPYVLRPHGTLDPYHRSRRRRRKGLYDFAIERRNLAHAAGLHFTSEDERRHALEAGVGGRSFVIPVPVTFEAPGSGTLDREFPQLAGTPFVLFLGRLTAKKGLQFLVAALSLLPDAMNLVLAGPDDEGLAAGLQDQARAAGVADRVLFVGAVAGRRKSALLQAARVFALPSADENFGVAAVEALAAGTPVVLTEQVAIHREVIRAGAGVIAERSAASVASAVEALLDRPDAGAAAAGLAQDCYSPAVVGAALDDMYATVMGKSLWKTTA